MANKIHLPHITFKRFEEYGLNISQLLLSAGIAINDNRSDKIYFNIEQYLAFFKAIATHTEDPMIGVKLGIAKSVSDFDPATFIAVHSVDFASGLDKMIAYNRVVCPKAVWVKKSANHIAVSTGFYGNNGQILPTYEILLDAFFSNLMSMLRLALADNIAPIAIHLSRANVSDEYSEFFACPIITRADSDEIIFDNNILHRPFITHNPDILSLLLPQMEQKIKNNHIPTLSEQVKQILSQMMNGKRPSIDRVASKLNISSRTLQRRLAEKDTSYQVLLDEVRFELACAMLKNTTMEMGEIAFYLGFAEINSFHRFFVQKQGGSPNEFRLA